ncbi:MAG: coenzyme F420-0:L-glutamate ligase [Candidatus Asgardarchaeia archaeon]
MKKITLIPIKTRIINPGENLLEFIISAIKENRVKLKNKDILVVTGKIIAYSQNRIVDLEKVTPSEKAIELGRRFGVEPELMQLIIDESDEILGGVKEYHFVLTIREGYMIGNAGIDRSNTPPGHVVLAPKDLKKVAKEIQEKIKTVFGVEVGVVIVDSRTQPLRRGLIGLAMGGAGFDPIDDLRGRPDLFGRPLRASWRGTADDIASAAHLLMGEAAERIPLVIVRGVDAAYNDTTFSSIDMYVPPEECLYFRSLKINSKKLRSRK